LTGWTVFPWTKRRVIFSLRRAFGSSEEVHESLIEIALDGNEDSNVREAALQSLGSFRIGRERLCEVAKSVAMDTNVVLELRLTGAVALRELGRVGVACAKEAAVSLASCSPGDALAVAAMGSEYARKFDVSVPTAYLARTDGSETYREAIAEQLSTGEIRFEGLSELLFKILQDRSDTTSIRCHAALGLARIAELPAAVDELWRLALDGKTGMRLRDSAVEALQMIGVRPEVYSDALFASLRSKDTTWALKRDLLRLAGTDPLRRAESLAIAQEILSDATNDNSLRESAASMVQLRVGQVDSSIVSAAVSSIWEEAVTHGGWSARRVITQLIATAPIDLGEAIDEWLEPAVTQVRGSAQQS
jgi:HEAT repeats